MRLTVDIPIDELDITIRCNKCNNKLDAYNVFSSEEDHITVDFCKHCEKEIIERVKSANQL